ncbi:MAG: CBS domain-containing protein, partial [Acidobacteriales bacterium]|nr:CBS domain-containing protein [Terriglobales bacterium]
MKVREIMTTDVATAQPDSTLEEVASMMKEEDTGAIPVLDEDELVGIITDRDIVVRCIAEGKDATETNVEDILSEDLATIEPDADVEEAARLMSQRQIRRLPVVEDGMLVGVISLGDIAVKEVDEEPAAQALEGVSRGVKQESGRG